MFGARRRGNLKISAFADVIDGKPYKAKPPTMSMRGPNHPMQALLRREMGIDTFSIDGDAAEITESWQDRPRIAPPKPNQYKR